MRIDSPKTGMFLKGWKQALSLKPAKSKDSQFHATSGTDMSQTSLCADTTSSINDIHMIATFNADSTTRSNAKSTPTPHRSTFSSRREKEPNSTRLRLSGPEESGGKSSPLLIRAPLSTKGIMISGAKRNVPIPDGGAPASVSTESFARLEYMTSYGGKMTFAIESDETSIGRKDDNDVVLTDPKISKRHACILKKDGVYYFVDLYSSNGAKINGIFVESGKHIALREGDVIMLGAIRLVFYTSPNSSSGGGNGSHIDDTLKLVTIMPSKGNFDELVAVKAEMSTEEDTDFLKVTDVTSIATLKEDYEKLRLAYELSKISLTHDITPHLEKSMELMFEILPVDRAVVLLVDQTTGTLATHLVKLRPGAQVEGKDIVLSSTVLKKVYETRKCMFLADAAEDKELKDAFDANATPIRSIICVPLFAHNKVLGIVHMDSETAIPNVSLKDLSIVTAISNQTAIAVENSILMSESEANARVTEQLSRFLAPQVVQKMTNRQEIIQKGGQMITGTIIFVDIRGFTNLSEKSQPVEVVQLLNDYFERLVKIVFKYNGVVDKYIGDALMAVFGTLEDEKDSEYRAVAAAVEFKVAIKEMNEDRVRVGKDPVSIGVGLNTGETLVGFIGSSQRLEYTCIGDSVNTSSRICSMAKQDQVLISEFTYAKVRDRVEAVLIGARQFKGKAKEVMVYEVFAVKPPEEIEKNDVCSPDVENDKTQMI